MRYIISVIIAVLLSISVPLSYAKDKIKHKQVIKAEQLYLYAKPLQQSHVLMKINPQHNLIPIYRKGNWLKVGNPDDGSVGWINLPQYQHLVDKISKPIVKSMYVSFMQAPNKNGKYEIIAYRNGKKISDTDAKKLFEQMRRDQWHTERQFWHIRWLMNRWFYNRMKGFEKEAGIFDKSFVPLKKPRKLWQFKILNPEKIIEKKSIFNFEKTEDKIRKAKEGLKR